MKLSDSIKVYEPSKLLIMFFRNVGANFLTSGHSDALPATNKFKTRERELELKDEYV